MSIGIGGLVVTTPYPKKQQHISAYGIVEGVLKTFNSVVKAFAHGVMGRRIDPSWGEPIELFLVPASALRLV